MVTQTDIAAAAGLDVSSVNKILNGVPGPVFRKETIRRVEAVARRLGYVRKPTSKGQLARALEQIRAVVQSERLGDQAKVREIALVLERAGRVGAA